MIWYEIHPAVLRTNELREQSARERLAAAVARGRSRTRHVHPDVDLKTFAAALRRAVRSTGRAIAGRGLDVRASR